MTINDGILPVKRCVKQKAINAEKIYKRDE